MKRQALAWLALLLAGTTQAQQLEVQLEGVAHDRGSLRLAVYDRAEGFRKADQAFTSRELPAQAGRVRVEFDLPPGQYAILAYHDEDANGELNRRFGMIPTEGYGLSNNPRVMGPPSFADSAFAVDAAAPQTIRIDMRY